MKAGFQMIITCSGVHSKCLVKQQSMSAKTSKQTLAHGVLQGSHNYTGSTTSSVSPSNIQRIILWHYCNTHVCMCLWMNTLN